MNLDPASGANDRTRPQPAAPREHYDVVIVGGRCAGAATAMLLARRGLRVLAVDRGQYGSDTLSTHALMRGGVLQLHRWGLTQALAGVPAVRKITFAYGDHPTEVPIEPRDGVEALFAPRRTLLDRLLVDAAVESGADVKYGAQLLQVLRDRSGRARGVVIDTEESAHRQVTSDLVIGADGLRSAVARLVHAQPYRTCLHASGMVYAHWIGVTAEGYEWYFKPGVSAGVIPTNDATCIFAAVPAAAFAETFRSSIAAGYHRLLSEISPELAYRVARAQRVGNFHGFAGQPGFLRQSWGRGWALAGDAGAFCDPLTLHGMTDALRDAELVADAVIAGTDAALAAYQTRRDELARDIFDVTDDIAAFEWNLDTLPPMHDALAAAMCHEARAMAGGSDVTDAAAREAPQPSSEPPRGEMAGRPRAGRRE